MSQEHYNKIQQTPVAELGNISAKDLFAWLKNKPDWVRNSILNSLARG